MKVWGFLAKNITLKPASQYLHGALAGITKPKRAFDMTGNASNRLLQKQNLIIQQNFYMRVCLHACMY